MSRGRGRPAGMVEFAPEDEQCKDIACRIMENAPDAFKQQLQKDGANVFPASAKPAKTKLASRKQLEEWPCMELGTRSFCLEDAFENMYRCINSTQEHLWLLRPLVDGSPVLPYATEALIRIWEAAVQQITANLDKDVIFLHVVEIKMMLQLLACNKGIP